MQPVASSFNRDDHVFRNQSSTVSRLRSERFCSIGCGSSISSTSPPSPVVPALPTLTTWRYPVLSFSNFVFASWSAVSLKWLPHLSCHQGERIIRRHLRLSRIARFIANEAHS